LFNVVPSCARPKCGLVGAWSGLKSAPYSFRERDLSSRATVRALPSHFDGSIHCCAACELFEWCVRRFSREARFSSCIVIPFSCTYGVCGPAWTGVVACDFRRLAAKVVSHSSRKVRMVSCRLTIGEVSGLMWLATAGTTSREWNSVEALRHFSPMRSRTRRCIWSKVRVVGCRFRTLPCGGKRVTVIAPQQRKTRDRA